MWRQRSPPKTTAWPAKAILWLPARISAVGSLWFQPLEAPRTSDNAARASAVLASASPSPPEQHAMYQSAHPRVFPQDKWQSHILCCCCLSTRKHMFLLVGTHPLSLGRKICGASTLTKQYPNLYFNTLSAFYLYILHL